MRTLAGIVLFAVVMLLIFTGCASQEAGATPPVSSDDAVTVVIEGNGAVLTDPDSRCYDARYMSIPTGGVASEVQFRNEGNVVFSVHRVEQDGSITLIGTLSPGGSVSVADESVGNFFAFRDEGGHDFAYFRVAADAIQIVVVHR